uniref:Uncharacterized protein n=1 Tax=Arion vulgaris TaxID=1028688 RepID=A0A0B6ZYW6_9EUPU
MTLRNYTHKHIENKNDNLQMKNYACQYKSEENQIHSFLNQDGYGKWRESNEIQNNKYTKY